MRSVYELRRTNLRSLMQQWGGPTSLSRKLGHANGSYLAQLIGPHPSREISEKVAREVEGKLGLAIGWLDQEHTEGAGVLDNQTLGDCVRAVASELRDAGLRPDPDRYANLVSLVYDNVRLQGRVDESYIKRLINLIR